MATNRQVHNAQKKMLSGRAKTSGYTPVSPYAWFSRIRDLPVLTFESIEMMLVDQTIRLGLSMRAAPVQSAEFGFEKDGQFVQGVRCHHKGVAQWVSAMLKKLWAYEIHKVLSSQIWGWSCGEVMWKTGRVEGKKRIVVDELLDRHARDCQAIDLDGQFWGVQFGGIPDRGNVQLPSGKSYWHSFEAEGGSYYGKSVMNGPHSAWYDKWCQGGALDVRRLFMLANAFSGRKVRYPEGVQSIEGLGENIPNRDIARMLVEQIMSGGVLAIPIAYDEQGRETWKVEEASFPSSPSHILEYPEKIDVDILHGLDIPDDFITGNSGGGAWQGKMVPMQAFYMGLNRFGLSVLKSMIRQVIEPGVFANFGKAIDFDVEMKRLDKQAMEMQKPGGQEAPGVPPGGAPGGMPGGLPGGAPGGPPGGGMIGMSAMEQDGGHYVTADQLASAARRAMRLALDGAQWNVTGAGSFMLRRGDKRRPYSCLMLPLPNDLADDVRRYAVTMIDKEDLAEKGIEADPHVTVAYGLETDDVRQIEHIAAQEGPVPLWMIGLSLFSSPEHDVLKIEVQSAALNRLRTAVLSAIPNTQTYDEYVPHVTVAYLKPGTGEKYVNADSQITREPGHVATWLKFSDRNGVKTDICLRGIVRFSADAGELNRRAQQAEAEGRKRVASMLRTLAKKAADVQPLEEAPKPVAAPKREGKPRRPGKPTLRGRGEKRGATAGPDLTPPTPVAGEVQGQKTRRKADRVRTVKGNAAAKAASQFLKEGKLEDAVREMKAAEEYGVPGGDILKLRKRVAKLRKEYIARNAAKLTEEFARAAAHRAKEEADKFIKARTGTYKDVLKKLTFANGGSIAVGNDRSIKAPPATWKLYLKNEKGKPVLDEDGKKIYIGDAKFSGGTVVGTVRMIWKPKLLDANWHQADIRYEMQGFDKDGTLHKQRKTITIDIVGDNILGAVTPVNRPQKTRSASKPGDRDAQKMVWEAKHDRPRLNTETDDDEGGATEMSLIKLGMDATELLRRSAEAAAAGKKRVASGLATRAKRAGASDAQIKRAMSGKMPAGAKAARKPAVAKGRKAGGKSRPMTEADANDAELFHRAFSAIFTSAPAAKAIKAEDVPDRLTGKNATKIAEKSAKKIKASIASHYGAILNKGVSKDDLKKASAMLSREDYDDYEDYGDYSGDYAEYTPRDRSKLSLGESVVADIVDGWAGTSADHSAIAIAVQELIGERFKIKAAYDPGQQMRRRGKGAAIDKAKEAMRVAVFAFADHVYAETQEAYKKAGVTHVPLWRGMDTKQKLANAGHDGGRYDANADIALQPLSSFSMDRGTADGFGDTLIASLVPVENIFCTFGTGLGCAGESEVVVFGRPLKAAAVTGGDDFFEYLKPERHEEAAKNKKKVPVKKLAESYASIASHPNIKSNKTVHSAVKQIAKFASGKMKDLNSGNKGKLPSSQVFDIAKKLKAAGVISSGTADKMIVSAYPWGEGNPGKYLADVLAKIKLKYKVK